MENCNSKKFIQNMHKNIEFEDAEQIPSRLLIAKICVDITENAPIFNRAELNSIFLYGPY